MSSACVPAGLTRPGRFLLTDLLTNRRKQGSTGHHERGGVREGNAHADAGMILRSTQQHDQRTPSKQAVASSSLVPAPRKSWNHEEYGVIVLDQHCMPFEIGHGLVQSIQSAACRPMEGKAGEGSAESRCLRSLQAREADHRRSRHPARTFSAGLRLADPRAKLQECQDAKQR